MEKETQEILNNIGILRGASNAIAIENIIRINAAIAYACKMLESCTYDLNNSDSMSTLTSEQLIEMGKHAACIDILKILRKEQQYVQ